MVSAALTNQTKIVLAENIMFDQPAGLRVLPIMLRAVLAKGFLDAACHSHLSLSHRGLYASVR
jgi:hypothetical protein